MVCQGFSTKPVDTSRVCKCWVGLAWTSKASVWEANTAISGTVLVFFPKRICGVQILVDLMSVLWSPITDAFHMGNSFRQSSVVKMPSEEVEAATTPANVRLKLELGPCTLSYKSTHRQGHFARVVIPICVTLMITM